MGNNSNHSTSKEVREKQKKERLGEGRLNNQGCLMKIVEYNKSDDIVVEFQDERKVIIKGRYKDFIKGSIKNPYHPSIYGVGMIGIRYSAKVGDKICREYYTWKNMLYRCYSGKYSKKYSTHDDVIVCKDWLCFENFYEWLHKQSNVENFLKGNNWILNRNIIVKDCNVYSPETCCLVPQNVNRLFIEQELNLEDASETVINKYIEYKENLIKKIAKEEFRNNNISEQCYNAMMKYKVEL